jgi:UDP-N-acetyl-D-mannosaminuronic acid dehydrogenase
MIVEVVGLGRAGLPLACVMASAGLKVVGVDTNSGIVDDINSGINPYPDEPGLDVSRISAYGACLPADVFVIVVPVGLTPDNEPDLSLLEEACRNVGGVLIEDNLVVVETTVPVGTTATVVRGWIEDASGLKLGEFYLAHSPERIMSGMAVSRLTNFPKVVGGVTAACGLRAHNFYSSFLLDVRMAADSKTAEFTKIAEGCYRDANIALANELYMAAHTYGIDYTEAARLANHEYCHLHRPSIGVGGHCIPVYPHFLISDSYIDRPLYIECARDLNDSMIHYWVNRILFEMDYDSQVTLCLRGITYRPGVKSIVGSRTINLYNELREYELDVGVFDENYTRAEIESLGLRYIDPSDANIVFDTHTLEIEHDQIG